jgi:hypothetical protein
MIAALALLSCTGAEFECDEQTPCGFAETCVEGVCETDGCATSAQCPMENYCVEGECTAGCSEDTDCYPGSSCDASLRSCVEDECVETAVDCGYREFCNAGTGDCYDAGDLYCRPCDEDYECGDGNYCLAGYCGVDCAGGRECPAGFECYPFSDQFGNIVTYQCFTYCWLFEDYDPGSFATAPLATPDLGECL